MKCQKCNSNMKFVEVSIDGAESKALSWQCNKCDYFEFDNKSASKIIKEIKQKYKFYNLKEVLKYAG